MEKRLLLAIVLSFIILLAFQALFFKQPADQKTAQTVVPAETTKTSAAPGATLPAAPPEKSEASPAVQENTSAAKPAPAGPVVAAEREEQIIIETSLYRAVWSNKGGVLRSWKLVRYKDDQGEPMELVFPGPVDNNRYPFSLVLDDAALAGRLNAANFAAPVKSLKLVDGQKSNVRFEYSDGQGVKVEKVFTFQGGRYDFGVAMSVLKDGKKIEPRVLWGPGLGAPLSPEELKKRFASALGLAVYASGKVFRTDERQFNPQQAAYNFADWSAYENNYFAALLINSGPNGTAAFLQEIKENMRPRYYLAASVPSQVFIGPKEYDLLKPLGPNTKGLLNFGFFGSIAEILLVIIRFIHKFIPNWGFAIIVLTFVIKIIFFPLTYSSTKSMAKMQEIQPKIKALRSKYKNAKRDIAQRRAMNEEMMKLYKEHGINPAGGCLPMLIQIPVFWGLFRMLVVAVEFRHSPWVFWIKDLSLKDPTYITPILMGATQFISQKMTPTGADPAQARIMLIMPVVMTIFFMNFQSGLVLYWLTSNVLQIGQQYIMNRMMLNKKRESNENRRSK
jgi:YidC/Oxa1 family membrane protein insertase